MKKTLTFALALLLSTWIIAQTKIPQLVSFSAIVRDANNQPLLNKPISIRLTFKEGGQNGNKVYCALHQSTTNQNGFMSIQLNRDVLGTGCNGSPSSAFENIKWENGGYWMEVEYQIVPGTPFVSLGQLELASTFYAFASGTAERAKNIDISGANNGDVLSYNLSTGKWEPKAISGITGPQGPKGDQGLAGVAGKNTLVKTTTEAVGSNCATGGTKVEIGLDANGNGVLDVSEVNSTLTKYVCNGAVGAQGPTGLLNNGSSAGNTPYWNGTNWITNSSNIYNNGGNIGVGTPTPTSKLEVNGAATNSIAFNAGSGSIIDFSQSNLAYTTLSGTSFTLNNIKNGGAYTLILTSTSNSGIASFSSTGFTFKYMGTYAMTSGKTHIYSFIVAGSNVYVTMASEN